MLYSCWLSQTVKINIMKTITGREIKVTPNYNKRTFTIRTKEKNGFKSKYRTIAFSKEEFENKEYNTANDWQNFLNRTNEYYVVK